MREDVEGSFKAFPVLALVQIATRDDKFLARTVKILENGDFSGLFARKHKRRLGTSQSRKPRKKRFLTLSILASRIFRLRFGGGPDSFL